MSAKRAKQRRRKERKDNNGMTRKDWNRARSRADFDIGRRLQQEAHAARHKELVDAIPEELREMAGIEVEPPPFTPQPTFRPVPRKKQ